ncbi:hypothetical protein Pcinc_041626 [Petrolisthes cinctipes]|uniref:Uncharacterized protein n=1 Tax=Petrolisthes cinctipes TaxID=88211 RepID=A0AAE1EI60_PETCI|nr:hypothetical protein Pcinc_041626 [Petrolisthes cinctipes]
MHTTFFHSLLHTPTNYKHHLHPSNPPSITPPHPSTHACHTVQHIAFIFDTTIVPCLPLRHASLSVCLRYELTDECPSLSLSTTPRQTCWPSSSPDHEDIMAVPGLTHAGTLAVVALEGRHHKGLHRRPQDTPPRHLSVWFLSAVVYGLVYKSTTIRHYYPLPSSSPKTKQRASLNRVSQREGLTGRP